MGLLSQCLIFALLGAVCAQQLDPAEGPVYSRHSVQKPFFSGDGFSIPHWEFGGNTVVTDDYIRLTPDRQAKRGSLWNTKKWEKDSFMMTVEFKVSGQGTKLFGDGFALWYTKEAGPSGSALGNTPQFEGMGIFFDTYDNHQEPHGHPWVSALLNDGKQVYDHDEDGKSQTTGGCQSFFRGKDEPTFARIIYRREYHTLEVFTKVHNDWEECFLVRDVFLESGFHFGATASTGDLADNHDIVSIKIQDPLPPSAAFVEQAEKYNAESPIASVNLAKRVQEEKIKFAMNQAKVVSNHKRSAEPVVVEGDSTSSLFSIFMIVLFVVVIGGGGYYAYSQSKSDPNPNKFGF